MRLIASLYFRTGNPVPRREEVTALVPSYECDTHKRFPVLESILGIDAVIQECVVTLFDATGKSFQAFLALQYRPDAPINIALRRLYPNTSWRGDIIAMKKGGKVLVTSFAGLREKRLLNEAVLKYVPARCWY